MEPAVLGILVTHASLGEELLRTAEEILGPQSGVIVVTNSSSSPENLTRLLEEQIAEGGGRPVILFVDLLGGSCGHVCQELLRRHPGTTVLSGVNLPMFLEFLHHRDRVALEELRERLLAKGRNGIQCLR